MGTIALASNVPGTRDYSDLRRSARTVQLDDGTGVPVAHPRDLLRMADASIVVTGVRVLALSAEHGLAVASLPLHHRDPFDRLLIAQARHEGCTLMTADTRIHAYDVAVLDPLV